MNRPYLFLSGEFRVTMPAVFSNEKWSHTTNVKGFAKNGDGTFRRSNVYETLKGVIYYADIEHEATRRKILNFLVENNVPCWPKPSRVLELDDRVTLLRECVEAGFVEHEVAFVSENERELLQGIDVPFVMKVGNLHRGQGKILVQSPSDIPSRWDGVATAEPFFRGTSVRVLTVGNRSWGIQMDNPDSWIKNSVGASTKLVDLPSSLMQHAAKVHNHFGLEISGIDYILDEAAQEFYFLEYNMFPGVDVDDAVTEHVKGFLLEKMKEVESQ